MTEKEFEGRYMQGFSRQQAAAVKAVEGPVLLLAVPGGGKTTVLVTRLGYMLHCCGIKPQNILTLTYTVAATKDMESRYRFLFADAADDFYGNDAGMAGGPGSLQSRAGDAQSALEFRTINGICARIILYYGRQIGRTPFQLETSEKQLAALVSDIYHQVTRDYATPSEIQSVRTQISYIKNMMLDEEEIRVLEEESDWPISVIYDQYCRALRRQGKMDYDDQMTYARVILQRSPQTLAHFRELYQYICVDEAQDTSKIQHEIIRLLAGERGNLFMVGDEDQSIYGFRAAWPQALLDFEKTYPGGKVLLMEDNYRSDAMIVGAADLFIQKNMLRHEKHMRPWRPAGRQIRLIEVKGRGAQYTYLKKVAQSVAEQMAEARGNIGTVLVGHEAEGSGYDMSIPDGQMRDRQTVELVSDTRQRQYVPQTAVLYRDNESMIPLVDLLERENIPYRLRNADLSFFTNRVVLDIQNILRLALDPGNTELFAQIYYKISSYLTKEAMQAACRGSERSGRPVLEWALQHLELGRRVQRRCLQLAMSLKQLSSDSPSNAITRIVGEMGYGDYLDRMQLGDGKLYILRRIAAREQTVEGFLGRIRDLSDLIRDRENDPACPFVLSTIHSSKGLEYDRVYLMDVIDGIFPESVPDTALIRASWKKEGISGRAARMTVQDEKDLARYEEERRLFYVAATRAKDQLFLFKVKSAQATFTEELAAGQRQLLREWEKEPSEEGECEGKARGGAAQSRGEIGRVTSRVSQRGAGRHSETGRRISGRTTGIAGIPGNAGSFGKKLGQGNPYTRKADRSDMPLTEDPDREQAFASFCDGLGEGLVIDHRILGRGVIISMNKKTVTAVFADGEKTLNLKILFEKGLISES